MKAMLLAAGEGTRLRPLTDKLPKPMLELGGRPLIAYLIDLLRSHGVRDIAINLHHRPEVIQDYLGDGSRLGVRVTYSREDVLLPAAAAGRSTAPAAGAASARNPARTRSSPPGPTLASMWWSRRSCDSSPPAPPSTSAPTCSPSFPG